MYKMCDFCFSLIAVGVRVREIKEKKIQSCKEVWVFSNYSPAVLSNSACSSKCLIKIISDVKCNYIII